MSARVPLHADVSLGWSRVVLWKGIIDLGAEFYVYLGRSDCDYC